MKQPKLTRAEYWILETAVDAPVSLHVLDASNYSAPDTVELTFNKRGHGLDTTELVETLPFGYRTRVRWTEELPPGDDLRDLAFGGYCAHRDGWYGWR